MSLRPQVIYVVPEETARVARAAFPKGTIYTRMYDALGSIFADQQFADLFPARGQAAEAPVRLALATILPFAKGLSDRQAADAVRSTTIKKRTADGFTNRMAYFFAVLEDKLGLREKLPPASP